MPNHRYESFTLQSSWTHAPSARGLKTSFTHTCRQQIRKYKSTVIIDMWEFLHTRYGGYGRAIKWLFLPQFYVLVITYSIFFFFTQHQRRQKEGKLNRHFSQIHLTKLGWIVNRTRVHDDINKMFRSKSWIKRHISCWMEKRKSKNDRRGEEIQFM